MSERRALGQMLAEVSDGVLGNPATPGLRVRSIEVSLPVEVAIEMRDSRPTVVAELPRFVFRTSFDKPPSRLRVLWAEGGPE
jgi:hypothetical protein